MIGEELESARAAMILFHGRGATAQDILTVAAEVQQPRWAYIAPQAAGNQWYPNPFIAPLESNELYLSDDFNMIDELLARVEQHVPIEHVVLLGFSQGACLTLEYVARHARRYGAVVGLSGGLIGPDGTPRDYAGSLAGTRVFLGCSDADPYIRKDRVLETGEVLKRMGAEVTVQLYPGMGHLVSEDELAVIREIARAL